MTICPYMGLFLLSSLYNFCSKYSILILCPVYKYSCNTLQYDSTWPTHFLNCLYCGLSPTGLKNVSLFPYSDVNSFLQSETSRWVVLWKSEITVWPLKRLKNLSQSVWISSYPSQPVWISSYPSQPVWIHSYPFQPVWILRTRLHWIHLYPFQLV